MPTVKGRRVATYTRQGDLMPTQDVWKSLALFLGGVILSGCVSWFLGPKNAVTQQELNSMMPGLISQYSPYTQDQKVLSEQLLTFREVQVKQGAAIEQMQIDLARVSDKLGVPAHPAIEVGIGGDK